MTSTTAVPTPVATRSDLLAGLMPMVMPEQAMASANVAPATGIRVRGGV
jgi:hypothetical protein